MAGIIEGREIIPATDVAYSQRVKAIATEAVDKYDIVTVTGNTGRILKVSRADADGAASVRVGPMFVALGKATAADDVIEIAPWAIVDSVDTSAASAAGDLVYLGFALPGGNVITKPAGADDAIIPVGRVLTVNASTGVMLLCPQDATLRSSMIRTGTVTLAAGGAASTVALGAAFANGFAVCSYTAQPTDASGDLSSNINGAGLLTIDSRVAPGGTGVVVAYVAYAAALTN